MDNEIIISNLDGIENQLLKLKKEDVTATQLTLIGFQLKTISSIRENTLTLSFIDSLINYLHISDLDEDRTESLRRQSHLLINNLIFFHRSSLEYEKASVKKEDDRLLLRKYDIYKEAISVLGDSLEVMLQLCLYKKKIAVDKDKLVNSILQIHKKSFNVLDAVVNLFREEKVLSAKYNEIVKLEIEFNKYLPILIFKLHQNIETFGTSALIAGLIENNRQILISEPIQKIITDTERPKRKKLIFNDPFKKLNEAVIIVGILITSVFITLFLIYLISLIFSDGTYIHSWILTLWNLKYWGLTILVVCYAVASILWFKRRTTLIKVKKASEVEYIKDHEMYNSLIKKQTRRIYDKFNTIYKDFHPYKKELPISYSEETKDFFKEED
ncbi:hypothetical protein ABE545_24065 [Sphingobacterium faecium]|uniref:hypothetical protein n=1 Tax=Sphingobacterium faecium TaxID=34087 RepID=UPI0032094428